MRILVVAAFLSIALAGCMESQSSVDVGGPSDSCWMFCESSDNSVAFDFGPIIVLGIVLVVAVVVIVVVAATSGRDGGQQQQQQVVIQMPEERR